jgi:hypothetical protein
VNRHHPPYRLGVFGASGYGKTEFVLRYLRAARASYRFVFDPEGEFAHCLGTYGARNPVQIGEQITSGWCVYDPSEAYGGDFAAGFDFFCTFAFEASKHLRGRKLFVVDEVWRYTRTANLSPAAENLVFTGRRHELDFVVIGQLPNRVNAAVRDSLTEVVCFCLTDANALDFPAQYGFDPDEVRALPRFEWISRTKGGAEKRSQGAVGLKRKLTVSPSA